MSDVNISITDYQLKEIVIQGFERIRVLFKDQLEIKIRQCCKCKKLYDYSDPISSEISTCENCYKKDVCFSCFYYHNDENFGFCTDKCQSEYFGRRPRQESHKANFW